MKLQLTLCEKHRKIQRNRNEKNLILHGPIFAIIENFEEKRKLC